jgi:hypothetical protein
VTTTNAAEVADGVTVSIGSGGTLRLLNSGAAIEPLHRNSAVTINAGGTLQVEQKNTVNGSITLDGGRLYTASGVETETIISGPLTVAQASVVQLCNRSRVSPVGHGAGKITVTGGNVDGRSCFGMQTNSDWTGDLDLAYTGSVRGVTGLSLAKTIPANLRLGSGAMFSHYNFSTTGWSGLPGVVSGNGTLTGYQSFTWEVSSTGTMSPGEAGVSGGVGNLKVAATTSVTNYTATLRFRSGSKYDCAFAGLGGAMYTNDCITVTGMLNGLGVCVISNGAALNVALWTPTNSVTLDATIIDTRSGAGGEGALTGTFSTVTWSNVTGWSNLMVTAIDNDLHITGFYTAPVGNPDSNGNGIPDEWEQQVFGNLTNSATGDNDGDGLDNFGEWVAGTHPTNAQSALKFTNLVQKAGSGRVLSWYSESNRFYTLGLSSNLLLDPFSNRLTNRMPANPPVNVYTDAVQRSGASFYQVTVTNQ